MPLRTTCLSLVALLLVVACTQAQPATTPAGQMENQAQPVTQPPANQARLRLVTTTSTQDSGLLDAILPAFEQSTGAKVDVIALGTGQALETAARGDADVVLVHARAREDQFVANGDGVGRHDVMYNDFILVGPQADPAGLSGLTSAQEAFAALHQKSAPFASRGDDSGTHTKEQAIWTAAKLDPKGQSWYQSLGQGMGETLIFANEQQAYTLTDRATYLSMRDRLPNLTIVVGGDTIAANPDKTLLNPYGVIPVNAAKHPGVNQPLAEAFAAWLTSPETQQMIGTFGVDRFQQPLFYPQASQP
jgi:tungstate transport system substrate-binding protein